MGKGHLVLIGGGLENNDVFEYIFTLAGGKKNARLAIIPAASGHVAGTSKAYTEYFTEIIGLDLSQIWVVPLATVDDMDTPDVDESKWKNNAFEPAICEKLALYNVVFLVGGDQRRYVETLNRNDKGSPMLEVLKDLYNNKGAVIAGTSAGTNIQGKNIITGGRSEEALSKEIAFTVEEDDGEKLAMLHGISMIDNAITDTHFNIRGRLGRLIKATDITNSRFGFGIAEETALVIYPDNETEVVGAGEVLIVDLKDIKKPVSENNLYKITNVRIHLLTKGDKFNLTTNEFLPAKNKENIKLTPYYDKSNYHISMDVFGQFEVSNILIYYILDNEANESAGIMDYEENYVKGDDSFLIHFIEKTDTLAYYAKEKLASDEDKDLYSGFNIHVNILPAKFLNHHKKSATYSVIGFAIDNCVKFVVFDNDKTNPICDAKIEIFDNEKLIFKRGTDKFGILTVEDLLIENKEYKILVGYEEEELSYNFVYKTDMNAVCVS